MTPIDLTSPQSIQYWKLPEKLPPGWKAEHSPLQLRWTKGRAHMPDEMVILDVRELDGKQWLHVSYSRRCTMPRYDDLAYVKRHFIGNDRHAIMIFPPASEHVNIHPFCLHLFSCLDGHPLPEFRELI